jgi:hypothetical protein
MSDQTELEQFINSCSNLPITVEKLKADQTKYNFIKYPIICWLCTNRKLTPEVLQWLLSNYPYSISNHHLIQILTNIELDWNICPMEKYIILIDYLIKIKGNLYRKLGKRGVNILHWIFDNKSFDAPMLNYLYQMDPQLDIWCEDIYEKSPLFYAISNSPRLLELLQIIKSYEPALSRTKIRTKYTEISANNWFERTINSHAKNSDQSTICAFVGLCGELFHLIEIKCLTQDICNQFYSSKYFCWSQDKDSLLKLIPEQFQTNLLNVNSHGRKTKPALRTQLEPE